MRRAGGPGGPGCQCGSGGQGCPGGQGGPGGPGGRKGARWSGEYKTQVEIQIPVRNLVE